MGNDDIATQFEEIWILLVGNPWARQEPTPIYDDIVAAQAAGIQDYHVHWRLEADLRADAYAEAEAAFYDDGPGFW